MSVTEIDAPVKTGRFLSAFRGPNPGRPPIWLMRQAGRYLPEYRETRARAGSFLDLCYTPKYAVEVALQPLRRFELDAAILFSDILVVPDGLGQPVRFDEGVGPVLSRLETTREFADLSLDRMRTSLAPVYETVNRLRAAVPREAAVIGFSGAPWTLATYMLEGKSSREYQLAKYWAYARPDDFSILIEVLVEAVAQHLIAQLEAGADALQIFDSWAGVLDDWGFRTWVEAPLAAIVGRVRARFPEVPIIAFARGAGARYAGLAARIGVDGVALDCTVPLAWAKANVQTEALVQGNLEPELLRIGGQAMAKAVSAIVSALSAGRFIFNLGHGVLPDTPVHHVEALVSMIRNGDYDIG